MFYIICMASFIKLHVQAKEVREKSYYEGDEANTL